MAQQGILLIDHGSRRAEANEVVRRVAQAVREQVGETIFVTYAHMELASPTIEEGFATCVSSGVRSIVAHPFMLAPGRHVTEDLPRFLGEAASRHSDVSWRLSAPLGAHSALARVVLERCGLEGQGSQSRLSEQRGAIFPRLVEVMQRLLAPDGCPWDRDQTLATLRSYVIEEAFEVVDAIDSGSPEALEEELGDLLLQIVFQAEVARSKGWFGPDDVIGGICEKLVRRHPHVFQGEQVQDAKAALAKWEALKAVEKKDRNPLDGVPAALPALLRAVRVGQKASSVGYDWPDAAGARNKVDEELQELEEALSGGDAIAAERELGDVLFALASFARKQGLDPESALRGSLNRFESRFRRADLHARERGTTLSAMTAADLDALWEHVKRASP